MIALRLKTGIEGAQYFEIEGGHFLNVEQPELVTELITEGTLPETHVERLTETRTDKGLNMA